MSRCARLPSVAFGWYFFAFKVIAGRSFFQTRDELDALRAVLTRTMPRHGVRIHFVKALPDKLYFGLHAGEVCIGRAMRDFAQRCAGSINRIQRQSGALFCQHAVQRLVEPGESFMGVGRCIHGAGGTPEFEDRWTQKSSCWSTESLYLAGGHRQAVNISAIRRIVAHGARAPAVQNAACIAAFGRSPTDSEQLTFNQGSLLDSRFIGSAEFIKRTCRKLGVQRHAQRSALQIPDATLHAIASEVLGDFRHIRCEDVPPRVRRSWTQWKERATLEGIRSHSRQQPLPMLRGLIASSMRRHSIPQRLIENFIGSRPRSVAAGRRYASALRFEALFGRSCGDLLNCLSHQGTRSPSMSQGMDRESRGVTHSAIHRIVAPGIQVSTSAVDLFVPSIRGSAKERTPAPPGEAAE